MKIKLTEEDKENKFTKEDFEALDIWKDLSRDNSNDEQNRAYKLLQKANDLTKDWGNKVLTNLFPNGKLGYFTNRPTNQANRFKPYTWVKIYPSKSAPKELAFTVGIDAYHGFITKIDTVGVDDKSEIRREYENIRGDFNNNSQIIAMLSIEEGVSKSLDELAEWSLESIKEFEISYDEICSKLKLSNVGVSDLSESIELEQISENNMTIKHPLNQILFGPAGTGKTYNTINHALSIIENKSIEEILEEEKSDNGNGRKEINKRFKALKKDGRINFVTFHQSFSYEDFVEGIRAETRQEIDDEGKVVSFLDYPVVSGVFKQVCEKACLPSLNSLVGKKFGSDYSINRISKDLIEIKKKTGKLIHLSRDTADYILKALSEEKITIDDIRDKNIIKKLGEQVLLEAHILNGYPTIWANLIELMSKVYYKTNKKIPKPYVLIIDEINRGNISRIFGELITLIEDSKREGASESLSVTLPYSGEKFSVPNNVYIIGTMNSSDRSLTGLDLALRRRFTFVEMQPDTSLLEGTVIDKKLNVGNLLQKMNDRIEVLLDRDHCIGHAYFMPLTGPDEATVENLKMIFLQQIIPLLQEYFFDDWSKINLVLNDNGMLKAEKIEDGLFKSSLRDEVSYLQEKKIWRLKINERVFDNIETYEKILIQGTDRVTSDDLQNAPE